MTFRAVGFGASAGGLEALSELLSALPAGTGMAGIVVQHLDPRHESLLPELLQKRSAVPVTVAANGAVVRPEHVYIIPPNATLTVADGRFHLTERPAFEHHLPVDALFRSLATEYSEDAIAVVLSGGDSDGSMGAQAVKHAGGIVFAQRPATAKFPNMPQHAIDTGCVDQVLSPIEIAHALRRLSRQPLRAASDLQAQWETPEAAADDEEACFARIFRAIRAVRGMDFTHYKRSTLRRRVLRRMALRGIDSLEDYCAGLEGDPGEIVALQQDFLIRVTEFFRDPDTDEVLRRRVFPALQAGRDRRQPIRIWVPGCATGEEVYSVAIHLLESVDAQLSPSEAQIFGTDVSETALEKARAGIYPPSITRTVSDDRLQRCFEKQDDNYRIRKEIRDLCIFARQDVTRDPPFSRLDLISCRNLLIYLDEVAQQRVFQAFHFALRPHGILLVGPAESVGRSSELFEQVDKGVRIYRRRPGSGLGAAGLRGGMPDSGAFELAPLERTLRVDAESFPREADRWLLARYAPASLLVDEALNIQQFRGRTGPFLEPASGPPSVDLRRVARPELLVELLPAIRQARETGLPVRRDALRLDHDCNVSIEVVPLAGPSGAQALLILLDDGSRPERARYPEISATSALPESEKDRRLTQVQHENETLRDYLRATIEEQGAVQEELKSAHEEMLSANEEYRSTNEELETAKEELQSSNEELTTTIEELRCRNRDLGMLNAELEQARLASEAARAYADAIIETVRFPLAVIDSERRIKRMNRAFIEDLEISHDTAEGALNDDAGDSPWNVPGLREKLNSVIREGRSMDDLEVTLNLPHRGPRVVVLNARRIPSDRGRDHLVLLAAEDVTDRARLAADLLLSGQRKDEFLAMLAHELRHPLTPITHAIHLLRRADVEPATAALHETIDTEARRLDRFINDLLDAVRVDRGLLDITRERLNLVDVVQRAAAAVQPLIELRRHALTLALSPAPILVDGDVGRLSQVVSNLLENAAKYTEPGGKVVLTVARHDDEALLSVRDNGAGIAAKDLERIFEPFTQTDSARKRGGGGLGLGLSVARRVVELHGGRIEANSAGPGAGSEFTVRLPTARVKETARSPAFDKASSVVRADARKVLIVDDREEVTKSLVRLLTSFGHRTAVAHDVASALECASTFEPDSAIVDIGLPDVSGFELARRLREAFPAKRLLLIAFTGSGGAHISNECRVAGFDACVVKPGDPRLLEKLLRDAPDG